MVSQEMEDICMTLISSAGEARSGYIEAIILAGMGEIDAAWESIRQAKESFGPAHETHMQMLTASAQSGAEEEICLLLIHAEDQMMSAEDFGILAEQHVLQAEKLKAAGIL